MKNSPKENEKSVIGGREYSWSYSCGKWSFKPTEKENISDGVAIIEKTLRSPVDGSAFKNAMSVRYINDIRGRSSSGNSKFKSAGSYGADIRR